MLHNRSFMKKLILLVIIFVIVIILILICFMYKQSTELSSNTRIGYYGRKNSLSFSAHGMTKNTAANKIHLAEHEIDWAYPIKAHDYIYYFPKNMPNYTRHYIINH